MSSLKTSNPLHRARSLVSRLALAVAGGTLAASAHAAIVVNPASIIDHGTYITDTVNNLDWYKFSNVATTVGLSFNASEAQFALLGWTVAGLDDVHGLQSQFGWTQDSFGFWGDNYGLTDAMSKYLGLTSSEAFSPDPSSTTTTYRISGMTWNGFCTIDTPATCDHNVTDSEFKTTADSTDPNNVLFTTIGDFVSGEDSYLFEASAQAGVGTWLLRTSSPQPEPDCGRVAPCPPGPGTVPEPGSAVLVLAGLGALGFRTRRQRQSTALVRP